MNFGQFEEKGHEQSIKALRGRALDAGFELENLSKLVFFENFSYDGRHHNYEQIAHIVYTATQTKHSINFIPTGTSYDTDLVVEFVDGSNLKIYQETRRFAQKDCFVAVAKAAWFLSRGSFWRRVTAYEQALARKGYVSWGDYQVTANSDIFYKHERLLNLTARTHHLRLAPFAVILEKKHKSLGDYVKIAWQGNHEIPISRDRDCFLYLMKHKFGIAWKGEEIPDPPTARKTNGSQSPRFDPRAQYLMIFGLNAAASTQEIKIAYRRLMREHHPDILSASGVSIEEIQKSEEFIKILNHAYEELMKYPQ